MPKKRRKFDPLLLLLAIDDAAVAVCAIVACPSSISRRRALLCLFCDQQQHVFVTQSNRDHQGCAPSPVGPYSQAVLTGNTLYVSGQVAIDPASGEMVGGGDVEAETRQVLKNMDMVLKEAGAWNLLHSKRGCRRRIELSNRNILANY